MIRQRETFLDFSRPNVTFTSVQANHPSIGEVEEIFEKTNKQTKQEKTVNRVTKTVTARSILLLFF